MRAGTCADRRFATVCVLGRDGPHVTPVAAVEAAGAWWFTTSRDAAKTRILRRDGRIAITRFDRDATRVISGRAHVVDPADPIGMLSRADLGVQSGRAVARLAGEHLRDVAGYVAGLLAGGRIPSSWLPAGRVLVALTPVHLTVLPNGGSEAIDAIGVADGDGPFALPGRFDGSNVTLDASTLHARRPDWSRGIAAMVEGPPASTPAEQTGLLVRGRVGDVHRFGDRVRVDMTPITMVRWRGFEATSRRLDAPAA